MYNLSCQCCLKREATVTLSVPVRPAFIGSDFSFINVGICADCLDDSERRTAFAQGLIAGAQWMAKQSGGNEPWK
jgi:hypothetical protein